jgi:FO synthase
MIRTRALQEETGGFTEFVPLPFVHMASPIYLQKKSRRGPTFRETLLMHAIGRIAYNGLVPNIQASWVKIGAEGGAQLLQSGCNDLGGTLMDENISRAAGAAHGQLMDEPGFQALVATANAADGGQRVLEQRTTLYGRVPAPA